MTLSNNYLDQFLANGNQAIHFKLIRKSEDINNDDNTFHPEMTHQHFGENETIFGYQGLRIDIYHSAGCLDSYINVSYTAKVDPSLSNGVPADDIMKLITDKMPSEFQTNMDCFLKVLRDDQGEAKFRPFGNLKHTYSLESKDGSMRHFEVYSLGYDTEVDALAPSFQKYHERLQTFLLFFVDGASYIDASDPAWTYYLLFERYKTSGNSADEPWRYAVVGYMTVYHFYAYPESERPRLSQVMILPPFQRSGHGQQLLKVFYRDCCANSKVRDITVEDPSENFQRMRDYVDCLSCRNLPEFSPTKLSEGFTKEMLEQAREKLRLNYRQCRRVYEILRLYHTDTENSDEMRSYRLCVKKRLNSATMRTTARNRQIMQLPEGSSNFGDTNPFSQENRWVALQKEFQCIMEEYEPVVEKLRNFDN